MEGRGILSTFAIVLIALLITVVTQGDASSDVRKSGSDLDGLAGQPVDIAPSAYQYRADREAEDNPPESWLALMRYAKLPLNKPVDVNDPAIKQALCGLLWEEIRPVQTIGVDLGGQRQAPARARGIGSRDAEQRGFCQLVVE